MSQSQRSIRFTIVRSAILAILTITSLSIAAAGTSAAGFSILDSVSGFFGLQATAPPPAAPNMDNPFGRNTGRPRAVTTVGNNPLLTYTVDDGTAEDSIGLTSGGTFVALNKFAVTGGNSLISSISIAWGTPAFPDPTLNGLPFTAVLWSDPNGDGSPTDAVVLAMAPGVIAAEGTATFITIPDSSVRCWDNKLLCRFLNNAWRRSISGRL